MAAATADIIFDVLCMGRSCIDLYAHETGVSITGVNSFDAYVGGCPTNVSVASRRLGLRASLLTAVGTDQVGDFVLAFLRREGVDVSAVPRFPERRTSAALVTIQGPDAFTLTFYREHCADLGLTIEHVRRAPLGSSRVVFLTGTALTDEPSRTATLFAAECARRLGATVIVDLDYRAALWTSPDVFAVNVRGLLAFAHLAIGTEEEVMAASSADDASTGAQLLLNAGPTAVILKRGGEGAVVWRPAAAPVTIPPFKIEVVNVLGAGDAFAGGFLYGHLHGWTLEEAARFGNATGAIVATRHGCANFMPRVAEVHEFFQAHGAALPR